ncbi:MAG: type II secretion system F family protein [Haloferacaceae archaeon]
MPPVLNFLPLLLAVLLVLPIVLAPVNRGANLLVSRVAIVLFGDYVANRNPRREEQIRRIRAARLETTHRIYAARTLLIAGVFGVVGGIFGVYLVAGMLEVLALGAETIRSAIPSWMYFLTALTRVSGLGPLQLFVLLLLSSATVGTGAAFGTYWLRWQLLEQRARARATEIEVTLPRTVGFIYALSRSGMPFPEVLTILTRNRVVYGAAAEEVGVAVRDMEAFGTDVMSALQRMSDYTPSEGLDEFADNLASVLSSGRSLSEFLREQHKRYQQEARSQQEQHLELLATFAEIYVTALVAGPLFLVTVLVVIGLVLENTLTIIRIIGYLGLPVATAAFILYLESMTETLPSRRELATRDETGMVGTPEVASPEVDIDVRHTDRVGSGGGPGVADGGVSRGPVRAHEREREQANRERLAAHDRLRGIRRWIEEPLETILDEPSATLVATMPVAVLWVLFRSVPIPLGPEAATVLDAPLVEAGVFVMTGYAIVYELQKHRARAIEKVVPDFLDRLASLNEAGMTIVESLGRVNRGDLGALGPEIDRTWIDIEWGADARTALRRLDERTRTVAVSLAVALITNAMEASGDLAPVLRIAAEEAQENRRLRRERRQEMLTYLLVIYISFLVFLGILTALTVSFIPAIEAASVGATGGPPGGPAGSAIPSDLFGGISGVDTAAYHTLFFHLAAIQGVCSGIVAGQLGEGDVRDGVKHAAVMLTLAYLVFLFV